MHPDGTIEFINKMNQLFNLEKIKIEVLAPYINYTSEELVNKTEIHLGILAITHSCTNSNFPCNKCNSCRKYHNFFNAYKKLRKKEELLKPIKIDGSNL